MLFPKAIHLILSTTSDQFCTNAQSSSQELPKLRHESRTSSELTSSKHGICTVFAVLAQFDTCCCYLLLGPSLLHYHYTPAVKETVAKIVAPKRKCRIGMLFRRMENQSNQKIKQHTTHFQSVKGLVQCLRLQGKLLRWRQYVDEHCLAGRMHQRLHSEKVFISNLLVIISLSPI